jgi:hypothetical protein
MAISNNSTGLRPGVCTSTTRPTAPYEGQMIYETDTDLTYIWGGSAWQQVSGGTAVGNSGLVYVKSQTIGTTVSTVEVTDAFSAIYDNYRIVISNVTCSANQPAFRMQLGSTTSGYAFAGFEINYTAASLNAAASSASTNWYIGNFGNATSMSSTVEVLRPFAAQNTNYNATAGSTIWSVVQNGYLNNTTSYSAFTLLLSSGTMTGGLISVYGYRKA